MGILQSANTEQTIISSYQPAYLTAALYLTTFLSDTSPLQTTRAAKTWLKPKDVLKTLKNEYTPIS